MSDTSQGPGWWQASDGKWYPPEQAPGAAPTGPPAGGPPPGYGTPPAYGAPAGGPGGPVSATEPFGYAWNKFMANAGPIIVAVLAFLAIVFVTGIVVFAITYNTSSFFIAFVFRVLLIFVSLLIQIGIIRVALKVINGEPVNSEGVLSTDQLGEFFVAALLLSIPFLFCYLPGVIVMFFAGFFGFFIVDQNQKAIESIKSSFSLVTENLGTVLVFEILAGVILVIGYCACLIGTFVALPVVVIAQAYLYRRLTNGVVAP